MAQGSQRYKAEALFVQCSRTDEGGRIYECGVTYRETHYSLIHLTGPSIRSYDDYKFWDGRDMEETVSDIAAGFTKYRHSPLLNKALDDGFFSVETYPISKYDFSESVPEGGRRRKSGAITYLLNDALRGYLLEYKDTPGKDELWSWVNSNDALRKRHNIRYYNQDSITYTLDCRILIRDTFISKFNKKIGTTSFLEEEWKEMRKYDKEMKKKSVGRPRKNTGNSDA